MSIVKQRPEFSPAMLGFFLTGKAIHSALEREGMPENGKISVYQARAHLVREVSHQTGIARSVLWRAVRGKLDCSQSRLTLWRHLNLNP